MNQDVGKQINNDLYISTTNDNDNDNDIDVDAYEPPEIHNMSQHDSTFSMNE